MHGPISDLPVLDFLISACDKNTVIAYIEVNLGGSPPVYIRRGNLLLGNSVMVALVILIQAA